MPKDLVINNGKLDTTKLVGAPNVRQINYILNADAEVDTTGWATYADAAQATPVDGTGGSPQASLWIRSTTTPIRGAGSFRLDKTGSATRQGQGASYAFTIDKADQAKVLSISFDYEVVSGTYATGDLTVYVYDVTNAQVIQPAGFSIEALGSGVQNKLIATFQTASNSTSYRLILHVASASTQNYTLAFDNVTVGPQTVQYGAPITDWQSYTPTVSGLGSGSYSTLNARYRRVGDSIEIKIYMIKDAVAGTGSTSVSFSLPFSVDTNKAFQNYSVGSCTIYNVEAAVSGYQAGAAFLNAGGSLVLINIGTGGTYAGSDFRANSEVSLEGTIPVAGFSSTVQMSSSTDTRVVSSQFGTSTANLSVTNNTVIIWPTVNFDTHGAYNSSNGTWTCPVPGIYDIVVSETSFSGTAYMWYYKNNVQAGMAAYWQTGQGVHSWASAISLVAGDQITFKANFTGNVLFASGFYQSKITITRRSGPSSIAATEKIAARYTSNGSALAIGNGGAYVKITYGGKDFDTHSAYNSGTYTVPVAGFYRISGSFLTNAFASGGSDRQIIISIYKNGVIQANYASTQTIITSSYRKTAQGSVLISCNAGDTLEVYGYADDGGVTMLSGNTTLNYVCFDRL